MELATAASWLVFVGRWSILAVLMALLVVMVLLFSFDEHDPTWKGTLARVAWRMLETAHRGVFRVLGPARCDKALIGLDWMLNKPNPLFQIFYVAVMLGAYAVFLYTAYGRLDQAVAWWHKYTAPVVMVATLASWVVCCVVDPGVITSDNVDGHADRYPYGKLYARRNSCSTCEFDKPARSKHCSTCNVCVARFDHHCQWINACVGLNSHRYFLVFLSLHTFMCSYGSYLLWSVLARLWEKLHEAGVSMVDDGMGQVFPIESYWALRAYLLYHCGPLTGLCFVACVMSVVLAVFTSFHVYLALTNVTTNERFKYAKLRAAMRKEDAAHRGADEHTRRRRAMFRDRLNVYDKGPWRNMWEVMSVSFT